MKRYHRSPKNLVQVQTFQYPWDLEQEISHFVNYDNHQRYHESLDNVTPADVYFGRAKEIQTRRQEIKRGTLEARRRQNTQRLQMAAHCPGVFLGWPSKPKKCVLTRSPDLSHSC